VGEQVTDLSVAGNLMDVLVRVLAVRLSGEQNVVAQRLLGNLRLLNISESIQEQLGPYRLFSRLAGFLVEVLTGGALSLEQAVQCCVVVRHLTKNLVQLSVNLLINNRL